MNQQVPSQNLAVSSSAKSIHEHEPAIADKGQIQTHDLVSSINPSATQVAVIGQAPQTGIAEQHAGNNDFKVNLALQNMGTDTGDGFSVLSTTNGKNIMRGLFRKVSRVFEKTTKIDDEERNRALLIGNFQIALK
jgi:hypothetical protein